MKNKLALLPRKEFELVYKIYLKGQIKEAINQIKILNEQSIISVDTERLLELKIKLLL